MKIFFLLIAVLSIKICFSQKLTLTNLKPKDLSNYLIDGIQYDSTKIKNQKSVKGYFDFKNGKIIENNFSDCVVSFDSINKSWFGLKRKGLDIVFKSTEFGDGRLYFVGDRIGNSTGLVLSFKDIETTFTLQYNPSGQSNSTLKTQNICSFAFNRLSCSDSLLKLERVNVINEKKGCTFSVIMSEEEFQPIIYNRSIFNSNEIQTMGDIKKWYLSLSKIEQMSGYQRIKEITYLILDYKYLNPFNFQNLYFNGFILSEK